MPKRPSGSLPVTCAGIIRARSPESTEAIPHEYDVEVGKLGTKGTALTRIDTIQHWRDCGDSLVWAVGFAGRCYMGEVGLPTYTLSPALKSVASIRRFYTDF